MIAKNSIGKMMSINLSFIPNPFTLLRRASHGKSRVPATPTIRKPNPMMAYPNPSKPPTTKKP